MNGTVGVMNCGTVGVMNCYPTHRNIESHRVIKRQTSESVDVEAYLVHEFVSFLLDTCDPHLYFDYCMEWRLNVGNFFEGPISKISI